MTPKPSTSPQDDVKYIGNGAFVPGVPARDMKADEWNALPVDLREQAKTLYSFSEKGIE